MRHVAASLAALVACALAAAPAGAVRAPDLVLEFGGTTLVSGDPGDGGLSAGLSAMWDVEGPLSFGLMAFANDMGTDLGRLRDANDGSDLGPVELRHRLAYGGAWRLDAAMPDFGRWSPYASTTWGGYRVQDDVRGEALGALSSVGLSVGVGVRHPVLATGELGVVARWHRVFRGGAARWLSVGADWQWHWGRRP